GLSFRRRAVDFVGEDHVGEDRSFDEVEDAAMRFGIFLDDVGAGDVAGHQIGRELNAVELQRENFGERGDNQRLGQTGHADKQAVAAGEHGDHEIVDDVGLADDDFAHFVEERFASVFQFFNGGNFAAAGGL